MTAAALNAKALLPRPPGGNGPGAALALAVHAALLLALTVSVDWRSQPADVVAAELWASVPQVAAPPPPAPEPRTDPQPAPPPPTPRVAEPPPRAAEADIAIERERRKAEAERRKREETERALAAEKKKRDEEAREAREAKAEEKRLAEQREANLRRIMGDAATAGGGRTGSATQDAAPSAAYAGRVAALIRRASVFTGSVAGNPATEVEVRTGAGGTIIARRIVKSSGHKPWDDAVLQAIDKVATLPRDSDGRVPAQLIIAFRPKDE